MPPAEAERGAPRISLLVVDDDRLFCDAVRRTVADLFTVSVAHRLDDARALVAGQGADLVVLDQQLPDGSGLSLVADILRANDGAKVLLTTGFPSFDSAVQALRDRVFDYLTKPLDLDQLRHILLRAARQRELEKVEAVERYRHQRELASTVATGGSAAWRQVEAFIACAARVEAPILLTGETGTGKTLVARAIHFASARSGEPFLALNCAALPEGLAEAELFGVERGAYTGAVTSRPGLFELASRGTLLLDEITESHPSLQPKLLGVLEEGAVRRLGALANRSVDTRVVAATNRDPDVAITEGRLRRDLYYRLNVLRLEIPPLRERPEDLPPLVGHLLQLLAPRQPRELAAGEIERLQRYAWPGNIRELRNVLERALMLDSGPVVQPSRLLPLSALATPPRPAPAAATIGSAAPLHELERQAILDAVAAHHGNQTRAAQALGISLSTLRRKLQRFASAADSK